jgi:hypothetical protein
MWQFAGPKFFAIFEFSIFRAIFCRLKIYENRQIQNFFHYVQVKAQNMDSTLKLGQKFKWITLKYKIFKKLYRFNHKNLRICVYRTGTPKKLTDLRFADLSYKVRISD